MAKMGLLLVGAAWVGLLIAGVYGYTVAVMPQQAYSCSQSETLNAAGATLAYPLLSAIIARYHAANPCIEINYQPVGSESGINEFASKLVDFGATYPPMNNRQQMNAPNALHIPESISAIAVTYNIPGLAGRLNLTGDVLAKIYLYQITKWNDPQVQDLNPNQNLPDKTISTIHADDAGSTFVFTGFLSAANSEFAGKVGQSITPAWPGSGVVVPADSEMASLIDKSPYSIGYMELSYVIQVQLNSSSGLKVAAIQNTAGNMITPSEETIQAAANKLRNELPGGDQDWQAVNLLNEPGTNAYPLVTFTYIIVFRELAVVSSMSAGKASALASFLWYVVHDGQSSGPALAYVPLPGNTVSIDEVSIKSITFKGQVALQS